MFMSNLLEPSYELYQERRVQLVSAIKKTCKERDIKNGMVILFSSFEKPDSLFTQESSFYYFSGIREAGMVITIDMAGSDAKSDLFVPNCLENKKKWSGVQSAIGAQEQDAQTFNFEKINFLGEKISGLNIYPYFTKDAYANLLCTISDCLKKNGTLFVLYPEDSHQYVEQKFVLDRIKSFLPNLNSDNIVDISEMVANFRRKKDIFEIGKISEAINLTALAHEAAATTIEHEALESEVQAVAEYMFTAACAKSAFPSIVASGTNGTILHYHKSCDQMMDGQLVIVDIGAKLDNYCADITRTYPVSGKFSERQKELYTIVLETQNYIATLAKPGYYLRNNEQKDKSLTHLALEFLKTKGYEQYFTHGIGHFLGLDVHDVGRLDSPLKEGDVITIEPGLYIPEEDIGIRIEDDYWITDKNAICLTESIPKEPGQIEKFMKSGFEKEIEN